MTHPLANYLHPSLRLSVLGLLALASSAFAADPNVFATKHGAIRGIDVVAYFNLEPGAKAVAGKDAHSYEWNGATWKFATEENREKFIEDPEKYAPQYGGYCAFAVSHGFTKPVNTNAWQIVDNKLYLNLSKGVRKKWAKDIPGHISSADNNWPHVLTACEAHDNCRD